ncbi:MAG: sigma 54-interacting transcriptional regulator [Clostridiales bacterium]|nr:sigma 54-interacting transcriptional regulator [Clostridiales bacterium]
MPNNPLSKIAAPYVEMLKQLLPEKSIVLIQDQEGSILNGKTNTKLSKNDFLQSNSDYKLYQSTPILGENDETIGYITLISPTDIDEKQNLLLELASGSIGREYISNTISQLNHKLYATLESIPVGVFVVDDKMHVTMTNAAIQKLLGIKEELMIGKHVDFFLNTNGFFDKLFKNKTNIYDKDMVFRTLKGKITCGVSTTLIEGTDFDFQGMIIKLKSTKYMYRFLDTTKDTTADYRFENIIGESKEIKKAIRISKIAAESDSSILLIGDTGTGKELFAQAIHNHSRRKDKPFIAVNCGAFPRGLIESELFGYEGGAFTGAKKEGQLGKFELAEGGTLFLDEIAEMPVDLQVSLLRVLQNKEIVRIGSNRIVKVDVRIIAATNKDVEAAIMNNTFRSDLYYRLNVFSINIPPLCKRKEDILLLADFFIEKYAYYLDKKIKVLDDEVKTIFINYKWPGNVRELENTIERAMYLSKNDKISVDDLPEYMINAYNKMSDAVYPAVNHISESSISNISGLDKLADAEKRIIIDTLKECQGNITKAAQSIGISRRALYRRLEKYNIYSEIYKNS